MASQVMLCLRLEKDLGRNIDDALFNNVVSTLLSKHKVTVTPASKVGSRVLRQCSKAKEILSTIGETGIVLENLPGDVDARISTQSTLEDPLKTWLQSLNRYLILCLTKLETLRERMSKLLKLVVAVLDPLRETRH